MPKHQNAEHIENNYDIVPPHLAVKAMQDNGYKSPAYAVAELIDNSIQAKATSVELLCLEEIDLMSLNQLIEGKWPKTWQGV